ncbi:DUF5808 domain-containing protein [Dictyobacter formicarum]|uniref:DUF5808 domain-containing protein n=1 Tax=Dictyobacter formicarum TaxID=2778368 RepID=A0ABQ3VCY4_9CHLR|nr:DUF5808 domain-containing protein [Dictyobacter formicarum]GHO83026.1 hypothetical protein KSZ_10320 [Dictyobacter formicarum]
MSSKKRHKKTKRLVNGLIGLTVSALFGMAIVEQLSRPAEERSWQGNVLGIPYDLRFPTRERLRNTMWNSETSRIFVPRAFGLGWDINLYPLIHPKSTQY